MVSFCVEKAVADLVEGGGMPPCKNSHKKMATVRGVLYFMFLAPFLQNFWIRY